MNYYNYFTEIEEYFVRRRGKHLLVSPMDWGLIAAWRDSGVPLAVALRGIDKAMDGFFSKNQRGNAKVNSLCYCHDSVMAEYTDYQESRIGESKPEPHPQAESAEQEGGSDMQNETEVAEALEYISSIIHEIKTVFAKQPICDSATEGGATEGGALEGIQRVLERLDDMARSLKESGRVEMEAIERDLGIADEILIEALRTEIHIEQINEWEKEAKAELKVYRKKLPKEMYRKIFDNFMRGKIHQKYNIREFSLFRL